METRVSQEVERSPPGVPERPERSLSGVWAWSERSLSGVLEQSPSGVERSPSRAFLVSVIVLHELLAFCLL